MKREKSGWRVKFFIPNNDICFQSENPLEHVLKNAFLSLPEQSRIFLFSLFSTDLFVTIH
jgi:hypothetical protein